MSSSYLAPPSPRGQSHGSEQLTDDEDLGDMLTTVRSLSLALDHAMDLASRVETSVKKTSATANRGSQAPSMRELELEGENDTLKDKLASLRGLIAERAPGLLSEADAVLGANAASMTGAVAEPPSSQLRPLPLEVDSPMLRDRMAKTEIALDELRQSLKMCVKSGQSFIVHAMQPEEGRRSFAVDLTKSGSYLLEMVGQIFLSLREERDILFAHLESDFVLPLASFANQDLKKV